MWYRKKDLRLHTYRKEQTKFTVTYFSKSLQRKNRGFHLPLKVDGMELVED
jgi:hypothetical protein